MNIDSVFDRFITPNLERIENDLLQREFELGISQNAKIKSVWDSFCDFFSRVIEFFQSKTWKSENQAIAIIYRNVGDVKEFIKTHPDQASQVKKTASEMLDLIVKIEKIRNFRISNEANEKSLIQPNIMKDFIPLIKNDVEPYLKKLADSSNSKTLKPSQSHPHSKPGKYSPSNSKPLTSSITEETLREWTKSIGENWDELDHNAKKLLITCVNDIQGSSKDITEKKLTEMIGGLFESQFSRRAEKIQNEKDKKLAEGKIFYEKQVSPFYLRKTVRSDGDCFIHALIAQLNPQTIKELETPSRKPSEYKILKKCRIFTPEMLLVLRVRAQLAAYIIENQHKNINLNKANNEPDLTLETSLGLVSDENSSDKESFDDYINKRLKTIALGQAVGSHSWVGAELAHTIMFLYKRPVHFFHPSEGLSFGKDKDANGREFDLKDSEGRPLPKWIITKAPNEEVVGWNPEPIRFIHNGLDHWDVLLPK